MTFLCPLTLKFPGTLCTITPGFVVLVLMILRYLYSKTPGFPILLVPCFVVVVVVVVCIGFNLCESTLFSFLVGCTLSFHKFTSLSGLVSKRTCPRTQCQEKNNAKTIVPIVLLGYVIIT